MAESSVAVTTTGPRMLQVPDSLVNPDLSDGAVRLYLAYASLSTVTRVVRPPASTLCAMLDISPATLYRRRDELEQAGFIQVRKVDQ